MRPTTQRTPSARRSRSYGSSRRCFDNRSGAGSTLGTEAGAKSPPDGDTLVTGIPAGVTIKPHIYPRLGYEAIEDLAPIAGFAISPLVVVVPADSPFETFPELVARARAHPGDLNYASNGSSSLPHLEEVRADSARRAAIAKAVGARAE